jgi:hypothetical protein
MVGLSLPGYVKFNLIRILYAGDLELSILLI